MFHRALLRFFASVSLAAGLLVAGAGPAAAHANILGTEPGYGASLASAPERVIIRYDLPVEVNGAKVDLLRAGKPVKVGRPRFASPDRKDVSVPLSKLDPGSYSLSWFLFGSDGDVMGGELSFAVGAPAGSTTAAAKADAARRPARSFAPLSRSQDIARLGGSGALALLLGGMTFVALLWPAGAALRRTRILLWGSLGVALFANLAALGLKGAAVQGKSELYAAVSPAAWTALNGTHTGRVLVARLGFLLLAVPVLALLTISTGRALRSQHWRMAAVIVAVGALATHGMLSHAYARGPLASATNVLHLAGVVVWLGGLAMLALVVLPRRRWDELSVLLRRFSNLAFVAVATAAAAGTALLLLISPRWGDLPASDYGRLLLGKLVLVAVLLMVASRARKFVWRRLPVPEVGGGARVPLQPLVGAVTAELCIAGSILIATALLAGRPPPT
jgi:copper transport protein